MTPFERPPIGMNLGRTAKLVAQAFDAALVEAGGTLPVWLTLLSVKSSELANQRELAGMTAAFLSHIDSELAGLKSAGLYKSERVISSMQSAEIEVGGEKVLNFCANNYLGLADSADLRKAATQALDRYGYGMAITRPTSMIWQRFRRSAHCCSTIPIRRSSPC